MQSISHTAYMREPKTKNLRWSLQCIPVVLKYMYVNTNSRSTGYILSICSEFIFLYINPSLQSVFSLDANVKKIVSYCQKICLIQYSNYKSGNLSRLSIEAVHF